MIIIIDLYKKYKDTVALDGLNLHVKAGEFFGYLGPNGAGKTTTVKILTTLARPTSGTALIKGYDIVRNPIEAKKHTGVVPQAINLDMELTAWENLRIHGLLYNMSRKFLRQQADYLLEFVGLNEQKHRLVKNYSGGMRRRLMIARALLHRPEVIFLDEPTVGLDPTVRRQLWGLLKRINQEGATIFLTTHYIEEAENLCDRVGIIDHGKLIALDKPSSLIASAGEVVVDVLEEDRLTSYFFSTRKEAGDFVAKLDLPATVRNANLEDVFVKLTGRRVTG